VCGLEPLFPTHCLSAQASNFGVGTQILGGLLMVSCLQIVAGRKPILFLSYRIKKLEVFEFQSLSNG
jgi:hypothetical protein